MDELSKTSKKQHKKKENELIDLLQGEINSLKYMMEEKDSLLEKMSHIFREKDTMISHLQTKLHNTTYDQSHYSLDKNVRTIKQAFRPSPDRRNSATESERSMRSLAYLMQKTNKDKLKKMQKREARDKEYLSHSHTETLSGSSTTSIVEKVYYKSWKVRKDAGSEVDDNFDREEEDEDSRGR